jgi:hypothetical protein
MGSLTVELAPEGMVFSLPSFSLHPVTQTLGVEKQVLRMNLIIQ